MGRQKILQRGTGSDLFAYFHIEPESKEVAAQAARATTDTVVAEIWGVGTSAYKTVMPSYGGWARYVESIAKKVGRDRFDRVCLTTWSAGSQIIKTVCRGAQHTWPDAIVSLDGLYGTKPAGAKPGDGNVILDAEFEAVAGFALEAARGNRLFVILHSSISTPYGSSGECAALIRHYVEQQLGREMERDESISAAELDGHQFTEALVLGNFHLLEFAGRDAKEHMRQAHLFDEVWRRWIPWANDGASAPTAPSAPATTTSSAATPSSTTPATSSAAAAATPPPGQRVLTRGDSGPDVAAVQHFLVGQGIVHLVADGQFGPLTESAVKTFQRARHLDPDGKVGPKTRAAMMALGFGGDAPPPSTSRSATDPAWFPPPPSFKPLVGNAERAQVFGRFAFVPAPTDQNPEGIRITDGWDRQNIVTVEVPQLRGVAGAPSHAKVSFHRLVAPKALTLFEAWEKAGLLSLVRSWGGSWAPRFIRGSRTTLSNHAFGSAFDINVAWNGLGTRGAAVGAVGSVRQLVPIANELGWYWGGHWTSGGRPDPMHFELATL